MMTSYPKTVGWFSLIFTYALFVWIAISACDQNLLTETKPSVVEKQKLLVEKVYFNGEVPNKLIFIPENLDSIEIFFNLPINASQFVASQISFVKSVGMTAPLTFDTRLKNGDSVILMTVVTKTPLQLGTSYTLQINKEIKSTLSEAVFDGIQQQYATSLLNDASLMVFENNVRDTISYNESLGLFYRLYENRVPLGAIKLILKPGRNASLLINTEKVTLDKNGFYEGTFNFNSAKEYSITVISQSNIPHYYKISFQNKPAMVVTSSFKNNDYLPAKYAARIDLSYPASVSPPLSWTNVPDSTNAYIIIGWNKDLPNSPYDWFVANILGSVKSVEEGAVIPLSNVLIPYEGFAIPPANVIYNIQYAVFALKRKNPSVPIDFSSGGIGAEAVLKNLVDYATDAVTNSRSYSTVSVHAEIPILGVAVIGGRYKSN